MIERETIDEIRTANDISSVIGSYVRLKRSSGSLMGLCPFHNEKTPSFHVREDRQTFHCFGCGASGNVITFIMRIENYEFLDAIKFLAERVNIDIESRPNTGYAKELNNKKNTLYDINKTAARFFYDILHTDLGKPTRDYILTRGLSNKIQKKCGLGYSPKGGPNLYEYLKDKGHGDDILLESGLITKRNNKYYDKFFDRLMFPIFDVSGKVAGFGGRVIGDGMPKYLNSPETLLFEKKKLLYGLNFARLSKKREIIVVEGYMDAIALYDAGIMNAVASLGTAFTQYHAKLLKRYADSVILLFDSDDAGIKAVYKALPHLLDEGLAIKVAQTENVKDPDDYIKQYGAQSLVNLLRIAKNHIAFQIDNERNKYDFLNNLNDKVLFTKSVSKILQGVESAIERDAYIKETAKQTGISENAIAIEIEDSPNIIETPNTVRTEKMRPYKAVENKIPKGLMDAQKELLGLIAVNKTVFDKINLYINELEFTDYVYKRLYTLIQRLYADKTPIEASSVISHFDTVDEQQTVTEIFDATLKQDGLSIEKALNEQIKIIKMFNIQKKRHLAQEQNDAEAVAAVLNEQKTVERLYISLLDG